MKAPIRISSVGIKNERAYIAHERGNWGPESSTSDYLKHPLFPSGDKILEISGDFLEDREEFKIVVPVSDEVEAKHIYGERMMKGAHVNSRFDFDANHRVLWLLAQNYPVVRPGEWNQNNIYV